MDNIKIEKLKREQIQTRIIGIVLLCAGSVLCRTFASFPLVFIPATLSFVGLIMTVRSFVHSKFAVLKQQDTVHSAQESNCSEKISESPKDLLMNSQSVSPSQAAPPDNESAEMHEKYIEVMKHFSTRLSEADSIKPPEIIALENYFSPTTPFHLYGEGPPEGVIDKTYINWLYMQGYDIEKSISEYISFKPRINEYKEMRLDYYANYILGSFYNDTTFFIINSREWLPKDKTTFERLRNTAIENSIRIVEKVPWCIYHDFVEEKYYRLDVDETWPGSADDAATYGAYHIREITNEDVLKYRIMYESWVKD